MSCRALLMVVVFCCLSVLAAPVPVVPKNANLRYLVPTSEPSAEWIKISFDDASWTLGTNGFGYDLDSRTNGVRNMSGHWTFDLNLADLGKDSSANANNLIHSGVVQNADGARGPSAEFHGNGQFVPLGAFPANMPLGNSPYTMSLWIKPDKTAVQGAQGLSGFLGYGQNGPTLVGKGNFFRLGGATANELHNYCWSDSSRDDIVRNASLGGINLTDGQWHHVLVTYDTNVRRMYANGLQLGGAQNRVANADYQGVNFAIGHTISGDRYHGLMDDVIIWKEALAPNQVKALAEKTDPTKLPDPNHIPYKDYLRTDVKAAMHTKQSTAYLRIPFTLESTYTPDTFLLRFRADDAFVAYLNGTEIFRKNMATPAAFNSVADQERSDQESVAVEEISLTEHSGLLLKGQNLLAVHLINNNKDSSDVLFEGELLHEIRDDDSDGLPDSWEIQYGFDPSSPTTPTDDADQDGLSNQEEFAAGSDPTDPASPNSNLTLRIQKLEGEVKLSFDAAINKSYSILYKDSLTDGGPWKNLINFPGSETAQELFHNDPSTGSARFYRLVTPSLPSVPE